MLPRVLRMVLVSVVAVVVMFTSAAWTSARAQEGPIAPELTGLGTVHMPVTTSVAQAQRFFDQGLRLLYAFNHAEAIRAFREAARLDSDLAMAYWGEALALGPNLNAPMSPENGRQAYAAVQRAVARAGRATPREQALIEALSRRYAADGKGERPALDPDSSTTPPTARSGPRRSIAHGSAPSLGGRLEAASAPGQGATFRNLVPLSGSGASASR